MGGNELVYLFLIVSFLLVDDIFKPVDLHLEMFFKDGLLFLFVLLVLVSCFGLFKAVNIVRKAVIFDGEYLDVVSQLFEFFFLCFVESVWRRLTEDDRLALVFVVVFMGYTNDSFEFVDDLFFFFYLALQASDQFLFLVGIAVA